MEKFIESHEIPSSLWDKSKKILTLPSELIRCWTSMLDVRNLLEDATKTVCTGSIGGIDEKATHKHYSFNFNGSSARFQLAFLDPNDDLQRISNAFTISLAGNNVFIADIPSGTGAASLSLLCNIAQLRQEKVMPTQPLEVIILAGELSEFAIKIFEESIEKIDEYLRLNEITVKLHTLIWDVTDKDYTSRLIKEITLKSQFSTTKLLLLANFTGFLSNSEKWKLAVPQFDELFRHYSGPSTTAIWLEPGTKKASSFLNQLTNWFQKTLKKLVSSNEDIVVETSNARFNHGLRHDTPRTNVSVVRFNTERL
jgi:hypothetical protein